MLDQYIIIAAIFAVVVLILAGSLFTVPQQSMAIIERLGKFHRNR
jgi:regulator of protease activity HflC (stomatin/prohibitin superfamily)